MAIHEQTGAVFVERLGPKDLIETFGFLDRDPVVNVYLMALALRDALARPRDEFWAARREGELVGLVHLGSRSGAVLPVCDAPDAVAPLAAQVLARREILPGRFQVIGPRVPVDAIVEGFRAEGVVPRLYRNQLYMALERGQLATRERLPEVRTASTADYDLLYESGALLRAEELEEDPRLADPAAYARRVEDECRDSSTHVWVDPHGLCFRAGVSAVTPDAAQVSGVYTPPSRRGQGFARRGLAELCARLLENSRAVCLFVNDFNAPALAVYRRLGFRVVAAWASAFYAIAR
jgi:predicted GNAT family acetyltransferase